MTPESRAEVQREVQADHELMHTPGPWHWEFSSSMGRWVLRNDEGEFVFQGGPPDQDFHPDESLLAAAPDLLAAAKIVKRLADSVIGGFPGVIHLSAGEVQTIRAAIAKAEGRS